MSNDRRDDRGNFESSDPDEVRLVSRDELESSDAPTQAWTADLLREANKAARREIHEEPATADDRQIAMQITEEGLIDLRSGEHRELGVMTGQQQLPNFEPDVTVASAADRETNMAKPADEEGAAWLRTLSTASGLGAIKVASDHEVGQKVMPGSESARISGRSDLQATRASVGGPADGDSEDPDVPEVPVNPNAVPGETEADGSQLVAPSGNKPVTHPEAPNSPEVAGGEPGEPGEGRRFRGGDSNVKAPKGPSFTERTKEARLSLPKRVGTGLAFAVAAVAAFSAGPMWTLALVTAVLLFATVEYFDALRRVGFKPATALGLLAVFGCSIAAYTRGEQGLLFVAAASVFFTLTWYLAGIVKQAPTANVAVTLLGIFWIGVLGSFAGLLLRLPDRQGMTLLIGTVLVTAAYDTAAYAGGVMFGRRKLAPSISPTKSWEGLIAGTGAAILAGALIVALMSPWSLVGGLMLGLIVSVLAPIGDLAESMIKRDLGLKDMGRILPGHGGVLDRFDALLLVLPGAFYLAVFLVV